jgi:pimeloyl-ACP methyl ester carboxylesterase
MWRLYFFFAFIWIPHFSSASSIQSKWIPVPGGQLYCEIAGKGKPVIFLHGYTLDCRLWDPQFFELAKKYRVIRYDLRGYGRSQAAVEIPYSHPADLITLMNALKIQRAHIVGLSLGASEGVDFLAQYPNRLLSLTTASGGVSPMHSSETDTPKLRAQRAMRRFHESAISAEKWKKLGIDVYRSQWLLTLYSICGPNRDAIWPQVQRMVKAWPGKQRLTADHRTRVEPPAFVRLAQPGRPRVPVLIIIGGYDKGTMASCSELARLVPNTKCVQIPNAGHLVNLECAKEFDQALEQFLATTSQK